MSIRFTISIAGLFVLWILHSRLDKPHWRQVRLLSASYIFYALWDIRFLALLVLSSLANYGLGIYLKRRVSAWRLWLGIGFNLALLATFKLLPSLSGWFHVLGVGNWLRSVALPLGISFWTFQSMSYLLDLYREEDLDPSLLEFCLYMAFFPTVVAGPIARLGNMLPQFRQPARLQWEQFGRGMQRVFLGIFMIAAGRVLGSGLGPNLGVDAGFSRTWQRWMSGPFASAMVSNSFSILPGIRIW
jgi:alginate O-acetyltransferase complex protein AlgI